MMNKSGKIDWKKFVLLFTVYISKNEREGKKRYLEEFFLKKKKIQITSTRKHHKKNKIPPPFLGPAGISYSNSC